MHYLKNYKTSIPAIMALIAVGLYWKGYITTEQLTVGVGVLTSVGLFGAKDANKNANG